MEEEKILKITKALDLKRDVIGVKFFVYESEYNNSQAVEVDDTNMPILTDLSSHGKRVKAKASNFNCKTGTYAVGLNETPEEDFSGRSEMSSGYYQSLAIAREIFANKQYINQSIYGIEFSPLRLMDDTDMVLIIAKAKDVMRIVQGYSRHYGVAKNLMTVANSGICSELISKPFMNNDINVSLLSKCTRENSNFEAGEMGVSMPIHLFYGVMDGILETVNYTENNRPKREILARLDDPEELGFPIEMNMDYGTRIFEYIQYAEEQEKKREEE